MDDYEGRKIDQKTHPDTDNAEGRNQEPEEGILRAEDEIIFRKADSRRCDSAIPIQNAASAGAGGCRVRRCQGNRKEGYC